MHLCRFETYLHTIIGVPLSFHILPLRSIHTRRLLPFSDRHIGTLEIKRAFVGQV